jgi:hypothetical protein
MVEVVSGVEDLRWWNSAWMQAGLEDVVSIMQGWARISGVLNSIRQTQRGDDRARVVDTSCEGHMMIIVWSIMHDKMDFWSLFKARHNVKDVVSELEG